MPRGGKRGGRRKRRRRKSRKPLIITLVTVAAVILAAVLIVPRLSGGSMEGSDAGRPDIQVELLTPNSYSRPQIRLKSIDGIVIHYTANPGATAQNNRDYFEGLKDSHTAKVSSHFVVGLEGEIIQCIPSSEIAYASNSRNTDTLSIECCHPDETGKFNDATYQSLVHLTAWLCNRFDVPTDQVIRHYDITGKDCPKYFVEHPEAWEQFLSDVKSEREILWNSSDSE